MAVTTDSRNLIEVDFGLGPRKLRYTIEATRMLKAKFGSIKNMYATEVFDALPDALYAGLIDKEGVTPEAIAAMVDLVDVPRLHKLFIHAFSGMDPDAKDEPKNGTPPIVTGETGETGSNPLTLITSGVSDTLP